MVASIDALIGAAKQSSDLKNRPQKIRYMQATTVHPENGGYFRMTFPKFTDDRLLDCRSIKLRFNMFIESNDEETCVDSTDIRTIFNRIRVLSGSQTLFDLSEAALFFQTETQIETHSGEDQLNYDRYLTGNQDLEIRKQYRETREYITSIAPLGSILNGPHLLCPSRMSDLHVEFWLEKPDRCLFSPNGYPDSTYRLSDIQILCNYIESQSISTYFNSTPLSFHVQDVSHRYSTVSNMNALIQWSSAHTSLEKVISIFRPQSQTVGLTQGGKLQNYYSAENIASYNIFLNCSLYFEVDVDSPEESWLHFKESYPCVANSEFFNMSFNKERNLICVNIAAAPPAFHKELLSGVKTANLNNPVTLRVNFKSPPSDVEVLRNDSFLVSSALIYMDGMNGDLKVKY